MRKKAILLAVLMIFALVSCGSFQTAKEQPFSTWSAKKKLTYAVNVYSSEYDKYIAAVTMPDLTEGQKDYLRQKKSALVGLDKAIDAMIPIVDSGGELPTDLESQLLSLLTMLGFQPM